MKTFDGAPIVDMDIVTASMRGFRALTQPICVVTEDWILKNIIADMRRGQINFALVAPGGNKRPEGQNARGQIGGAA